MVFSWKWHKRTCHFSIIGKKTSKRKKDGITNHENLLGYGHEDTDTVTLFSLLGYG
jgi:hypothetical protein